MHRYNKMFKERRTKAGRGFEAMCATYGNDQYEAGVFAPDIESLRNCWDRLGLDGLDESRVQRVVLVHDRKRSPRNRYEAEQIARRTSPVYTHR